MQRVCGMVLAWSVLAVGLASAVPARPLYVPEPAPKQPEPRPLINLGGTTWLGKYTVADRIYTFEVDGTVSYKSSPATKVSIKNRGNWKFDGVQFYFDHHIGTNKLIEFRGVLQDGNTIVGEQTILKTGVKSPVVMKRAP